MNNTSRLATSDVGFLSPNELFEYQNEKFKKMVNLVSNYHPFYKKRFEDLGIDIQNFDLTKLDLIPSTEKNDLALNYSDFKLELPAELFDPIWDIAYTSGSTSEPIPIYQTTHDFKAILLSQRRMAEIRGMHSDDRILNLFPITQYPHGAWTRANHAAATLGAYVACGMSGTPDQEFGATRSLKQVVELAVRLNPTVFWGVPSFIKKVLDELVAGGYQVPALRMIAVSGEPCTDAMKQNLVETSKLIGAKATVSNSLGASELQCGLVECEDGTGFHNPAPELFYFSVVDEVGVEVPTDKFGTLTVTHLDRRGSVLIKYLLGDQVHLSKDPCPSCGRSGGRIVAHKGRGGTLIKVKGQLLDRGVLEKTVSEYPDVRDYMIRIKKVDPSNGLSEDLLQIEVVIADGLDSSAFATAMSQHVKKAINVSPKINVVSAAELTIENVSIKTSRFKDER